MARRAIAFPVFLIVSYIKKKIARKITAASKSQSTPDRVWRPRAVLELALALSHVTGVRVRCQEEG